MRAARIVTALAVACVAGAAVAVPAASAEPDPAVVQTAQGAVRGEVSEDVRVFQGIPYAAPPTGELRWRAPRPATPWTGVRDATKPGEPCPQEGYFPDDPPVVGSEDCLHVNVTTPRGGGARKPVLVFLHGGGFTGGQGALYNVDRLSAQGDAVVVTVNYRLGALGFLAHRSLRDPYAGNFGVADQQAALRWVRRNIENFGGDRHNVTLWGESAGSAGVCAQIASPAARGLFDKAIAQSGSCGVEMLTRSEAYDRGEAAAAKLGCSDAECLRGKPADELVLQLNEPSPALRVRRADFLRWGPVTGTPALPHQPLTAIRHGATAGKPVIFGGTRDEMSFLVGIYYDGRGKPITAEQYPRVLRELYGERAGAVEARYPHQDYPSPSLALTRALTDDGRFLGTCTGLPAAEAAARNSATFSYEFAESSGAFMGELPLGAVHGADMPYLTDGNLPGGEPLTPEQKVLADKLIGYWSTFARTGRPGPDWPRYQHGQALSLAIDHIGMVDVARAHQCGFWLGAEGG